MTRSIRHVSAVIISVNVTERFDCDQYVKERKTNLYYPFASWDEWELAAFLLRSDLSMASIDSFLSLKLVSLVQRGLGPTLTALA